MAEFETPIQIRWSDLDPNLHVRHSVYYDWGALARLGFLSDNGITTTELQKLRIGPILFREEAVFKKEIKLGDELTIHVGLLQARTDFSRWSMRHRIVKGGNTLCAIITVDGAWLDIVNRKLAVPPAEVSEAFRNMPATEDFKWDER